jgi:N-acetylglutamate synthase-like GNAT family acetyltransferase
MIEPRDYAAVNVLSESLHEWFDENGRRMIPIDMQFQQGIVAEIDGDIAGFLLYYANQGIAWIGWMGIDINHQRIGVGTAILKRMIEDVRNKDVKEIRVSTLGDSVDYPPYERTRAFYWKHGFVEHKRIKHNRESMPEELILKLTI